MTAKRIIPCLDVKGGRVVKGIKFVDLRDKGDPTELASKYEDEGADEIVFLDITATIEERNTLFDVVKDTASVLSIPLAVGGGLRTLNDLYRALSSGADKVSINTAAVEHPDLIKAASMEFGSQSVVVAVDVKNVGSKYLVCVKSGTVMTDLDVRTWVKNVEELGAGEILLTSIDRDGTRLGYDVELVKIVSKTVSIPIIASGGAGHHVHFYEVLVEGGADAALAAGVFHDGLIRIDELKKYLRNLGVEVRL